MRARACRVLLGQYPRGGPRVVGSAAKRAHSAVETAIPVALVVDFRALQAAIRVRSVQHTFVLRRAARGLTHTVRCPLFRHWAASWARGPFLGWCVTRPLTGGAPAIAAAADRPIITPRAVAFGRQACMAAAACKIENLPR